MTTIAPRILGRLRRMDSMDIILHIIQVPTGPIQFVGFCMKPSILGLDSFDCPNVMVFLRVFLSV